MNARQKKKRRKQVRSGYVKAKIRKRNRNLCERYPFLIPRNDWTGEISFWGKPYGHTLLDEMPDGWRKAFGLMMCEELRNELLKYDYLKKYRVVQVKEKYAQLRWYDNGVPKGCEVWNIVEKYSTLSQNICFRCGRPDTWITDEGWILPECYHCFKKRIKSREPHVTENELFEKYHKIKCGETSKMNDFRVFTSYKDGNHVTNKIDISETAEKIRAKWRAEHETERGSCIS